MLRHMLTNGFLRAALLRLCIIFKGMYSGETPKRFSKHRRQLRDSIVQWNVYKRSLLINT
jgi:hypothetical protein